MDRLTTRRPLIIVAVVSAMLAAGCAGRPPVPRSAPSRRTATPRPAAPPPPLAYAAPGRIRLRMSDGSTRTPATVPHGRVVRQITWSADGRRLAWLTQWPGGAADRVYLLTATETATAHPWSWPCPCENIAFDGERLLSDDESPAGPPHLLTYPDAGRPRRVVVRGLKVRPGYPTDPAFTLHAGSAAESGIIIGYSIPGASMYGGPQQLYELDRSGRAVKLVLDRGQITPGRFARSPDGRLLAFVTSYHSGACASYSAVTIVDPVTRTARMPALPPLADDFTKWYVRAVWFDQEDTAFAAFAPSVSACRGDRPEGQVQPAVYREDHGRWAATGQTALARAYTRAGQWADLDGTVQRGSFGLGEDSPFGGSLTVSDGRRADPVTYGVTAMAWAP